MSLVEITDRLETAWWNKDDPLARALAPLSWLYGLVWRVYTSVYERGWRASLHLDIPVVVVGNLIVGGAGKTPAVLAVTLLLQRHGYKPGIVSRGYGRVVDTLAHVDARSDPDLVGDEPLLLHLRGRVPVTVARDRATAAVELKRRHPEVDVIVSDDGLQHLALARDVNVVVFDERGAGNGRTLPAGPLREPMGKRAPADSIVLYNAAAPTTAWRGATARRELVGAVELGAWWRGEAASRAAFDGLRGRRIVAVAGTAVPERFFSMLEAEGLEIERCPLPDHHDYDTLPWSADDRDVIVTEKDAVKLKPERTLNTRVWVVPLDFEPEPVFAEALLRRVEKARGRH